MKSKILFFALFIAFLGITNISMAGNGGFAGNHPRRAEVNHRLRNQHQRIHQKMKNGDISRRQAHRLHHRDHRIRREERKMANRHHGHLTSRDKFRLNRQENRVSHKIVRA